MAASTIEGDYIGQAEAFDSRELTGMTLRSAVPGDAWDLVRIEGARGSNFPQLHPGQRPVPINEPAFFDLVVAANGSKRQQTAATIRQSGGPGPYTPAGFAQFCQDNRIRPASTVTGRASD
jgi:hypothetical protein